MFCKLTRYPVRLWQQYNRLTLRISGFVDDVTFSHNAANTPESSTTLFRRVWNESDVRQAETTLCLVEFARWRYGGEVAVYNCGLVTKCRRETQDTNGDLCRY